jgi:hypothetical protein
MTELALKMLEDRVRACNISRRKTFVRWRSIYCISDNIKHIEISLLLVERNERSLAREPVIVLKILSSGMYRYIGW